MTRMLYPIEGEAPTALDMLGGMSRSAMYEEIKAGRLATVKIGRRTYVTHSELERYVSTLVDGAR